MTKNDKYEAMYKLYCTGLTIEAVGKEFGITRQAVDVGFKRRGYKLRNRKLIENNLYKRMYDCHCSGTSLDRLGRIFEKRRSTLYKGFKRRGYKLRSDNDKSVRDALYADMYDMYSRGISLVQVGKSFGRDWSGIRNGFLKRGYKLRRIKL